MDLSMQCIFFDGNFDGECEGFAFDSTAFPSENLFKKFELNKLELVETPPLSPSQQRDEDFACSPLGLRSSNDMSLVGLASSPPDTPPDSEDEHEQPLAGEDLMWSSSSPFPVANGLTSSAGTTKNVQLKYKLNEESATEKFSQFPYSLNDTFNFVQRPTALKRPAESEGEEEVDVVSVEPQSRIDQPCAPQTSALNSVSSSEEGGSVSVTAPVPFIPRPTPPLSSLSARPPPAKRIRRERSTAGRLSSFDTDDSDESKRATHNVLERRRREDLKLLYTNLRRTLPDLVSNERAAKVKILEHAFTHVDDLKGNHVRLLQTLAYEERRNVYLHKHLATVRAKAAEVM